MDPKDALRIKQERRYRLLRAVYDDANGEERVGVDIYDVGRKAGLSASEIRNAEGYLFGEGLVGRHTVADWLITHAGVVEIEASIARPQEPTEHFEAPVIMNVTNNSVFNGPVGAVQHGDNSTANVRQEVTTTNSELRVLLATARTAADQLPTDEERTDAKELITELEAQASSAKPSRSKLKALVAGLREFASETLSKTVAEIATRAMPGG